jgi:hypothetical protein
MVGTTLLMLLPVSSWAGPRGGGGFSRSGSASGGSFSGRSGGGGFSRSGSTSASRQRTQGGFSQQATRSSSSGTRQQTAQRGQATRQQSASTNRANRQQSASTNQANRQAQQDDRQASRQSQRDENREDWQSHLEDQQEDRQDFADDMFEEHGGAYWYGGGVYVGHPYYYDNVGEVFAAFAAGLVIGSAISASAYQSSVAKSGCTMSEVSVNGTMYYHCPPNWFTRVMQGGQVTYMVVAAPPGF